MSNIAFKVNSISYAYGSYQVLKETTFTIDRGETVVIIGPNGAGKTTLMLCLSGLLRPKTGKVFVEGNELYQRECDAKRGLSFLPDIPHFYQELTAWEHILFIAQAHNVEGGFEKRAERLLNDFELSEAKDMFPHALSRGMRLKLGIVLCLIRPFSVLLMDEPTSALDPVGTMVLRNKLSDLSTNGAAIVITTHDLSLSKELGSRKANMQKGHLDFN